MNAARAPCGDGAAAANGDAGTLWAAAEEGADDEEADSKGLAAAFLAGASNPNPSEGSATWNGESDLPVSGCFAGFSLLSAFVSALSSTTVNGESFRVPIANGLVEDGAPPVSEATENGESCRFCDGLEKLSNIPLWVLMMKMYGVFWHALTALPLKEKKLRQPESRARRAKNFRRGRFRPAAA